MKNIKPGSNIGVWCGEIISEPEISHQVKGKNGENVQFYKFYIRVERTNREGKVVNRSELPVVVSQRTVDENDFEVGKIVFLKDPWRTYNVRDESEKMHVKQMIFAHKVEIHEDYPVKTRNKLKIEGVLVDKIKKSKVNEKGKLERTQEGKLIPELTEDGKPVYDVRKKGERIVNDYTIAVNRYSREFLNELTKQIAADVSKRKAVEVATEEEISQLKEKFIKEKRKIYDTDHIPCISFGDLAQYVCDELEIPSEVVASGYVRSRTYKKRKENGERELRTAYEFVVKEITKKESKNQV